MNHCKVVGFDLAKNSFALHGAEADGTVVFTKTLKRDKVLPFLKSQASCLVAMECCAGTHYWARAIQAMGHEVKLIPAKYVKPYVQRQKNDANDAAGIAEAGSRASIRSVAVKSRETQGFASFLRASSNFVDQRT